MKYLLIILLQLLMLNANAQYIGDRYAETAEDNDELLTRERDEDTGLLREAYNIKQDSGRYSFLYHINADLKNAVDISTFEFIYGQKRDFGWLEFSIAKISGEFQELTENNAALGGESQDLQEESDGVLVLGVGLGWRTKYVRHLVAMDTLYETISAQVTYNQFDENFRGESFSGPGIKADFGIHKRTSEAFHFGVRMSYNLAHVKKAQEFEGHSSPARSLLLTWLSLGLDLTFYY
ncbi:MAG: hypothetical protein EP326_04640 [Deltaproteobacteria bacterium]|nr:MAG: hypothetical protein EP326_04640 [Deltaproteobacteria bacterium]